MATATIVATGSPPASETVTKYYYFGSQRVAMRKGDVLYYLHGDHLGPTSLTTDITGGIVAHLCRTTGAGKRATCPTARSAGRAARPRPISRTHGSAPTITRTWSRWAPGGSAEHSVASPQRSGGDDPYLNRWISADSIVPDFKNPQSLNRYAYVYNRPLTFIDDGGHIPIIPLLIFMGGVALLCTASNPLPPDQQPPDWQGLLAIGLMGVGEYLMPALCADGNCANELEAAAKSGQVANSTGTVSKFVSSDTAALERFADEAPAIQAERGLKSFGQTWTAWGHTASQDPEVAENLFLYRVADKVMGAMKIVSRPASNALEIQNLEGLGEGAGTKLMQTAVKESMARGYGGRVFAHAVNQSIEFYQKMGGVLVDPVEHTFFFDEQAAALLEK